MVQAISLRPWVSRDLVLSIRADPLHRPRQPPFSLRSKSFIISEGIVTPNLPLYFQSRGPHFGRIEVLRRRAQRRRGGMEVAVNTHRSSDVENSMLLVEFEKRGSAVLS